MLDNKFNPQEAEPRLYKMWEQSGAFKPRPAKPTDTKDDNFSVVIPPPNVTGSLHMGHAVNNTIQDILVRYNRMKGKAVLWQPGTDHAGIATQMVVERKLAGEGKARKGMTRDKFLEHVWAWKAESGGNINQQLRRLGSSCDWSREKFTLGNPEDPSDKMAEAVTKAFVEMYETTFDETTKEFRKRKSNEKGLIYRDKRLVNWDPHFQTAISDLEVETKTVDGHYWHLRYPLADGASYEHPITDEEGNVTGHETRDYVVVATSRPETMLGDTGVAVHPDDKRYVGLVGKHIILPIVNRRVPIIADDYADPEKGSGAVKITPAHDFNDYEVGKRAGHELISILDERGHILPLDIIPAEFHGLFSVKARKLVVAKFEEAGLLAETENLKIEQPVGDRSGVVIEPMLTDQWFVAADKLAGEAMEAVARGHDTSLSHGERGDREAVGEGLDVAEAHDTDKSNPSSAPSGHLLPMGEGDKGATRFIPENWKKTYDHWMKDIQPWCISRQLWWGHQIPAWYVPSSGYNMMQTGNEKIVVAPTFEEAVEKVKLLEDGRYNCKIVEAENHLDGYNYYQGMGAIDKRVIPIWRDPDVLDTWFSSGLWPFSTLGWPENTDELERFYPTSVVVTAFDIIFFWVARMMMQGIHFMDDVPFEDIYIHALVLDEAGKKMSKSIGNTLDPLDLIDGVSIDELVAKRTRGLKNPEKAPQIEKATRKQYPDGFEPYGADALRFTLASQAGQGRNIRLSVDRIAGYRNFGTKLWSAASFGQMNDCNTVKGFDPSTAAMTVNRWIISELTQTVSEVSRCIESYRFNDAADAIYKFTWDTFCNYYLEMTKPILTGDNQAELTETRASFAWVRDQIIKLLHPFMPFITEDIWLKTSDRPQALIISDWPELSDDLINDAATTDMNWLIELITNIRSVRAEMNIPPSKKAPLLMLADKLDPRLASYAEVLSPMARVDGVETASEAPKGALQTVVDGVTFAIPLDGLIDKGAEQARLTKEAEKAQAEIDKIDKKLSNKAFTDKAPEKVVNLQKERREGYVAELEKLKEALANLG